MIYAPFPRCQGKQLMERANVDTCLCFDEPTEQVRKRTQRHSRLLRPEKKLAGTNFCSFVMSHAQIITVKS